VGKSLVQRAEEFARQHGCLEVELLSANRRRAEGTHAFYKGLRYQHHSERDVSFFSKETAAASALGVEG